ncbi:hypothetical protein M5689_007005 [Euphorbia peplus]|nr:hypothetical protein M5689_007005 [Euphorbia peplus]
MASSYPNPLLLTLLIAIFISSASARPCKTLLISSYSFSVKPLFPNSNPNSPTPSGFLTIVTEITRHRSSSEILFNRRRFPIVIDDAPIMIDQGGLRARRQDSPLLPFGLSSYDMSSLRDRTKDILSVVVALLFGVGCGALTAASMYLVWSLFSTRYEYRFDEFEDEDEDEDDVKKMGYVKIPEGDNVVKPAKEVI